MAKCTPKSAGCGSSISVLVEKVMRRPGGHVVFLPSRQPAERFDFVFVVLANIIVSCLQIMPINRRIFLTPVFTKPK